MARNPLLIPGLIFGVVCVLLIGAVIVYAVAAGDEASPSAAEAASPSRTVSRSPQPAAPGKTPSGTASGSAGPSAGPSSSVNPSANPSANPSGNPNASPNASPNVTGAAGCVVGVWLEEQRDEQVTVINTGVFPFRGTGAYQRYSDTGRVVFDYGNGVHLTGANGTTTFDYVFTGLISYSFKVENDMIVYADPRPNGTETFFRNGRQDYAGKLEARIPQPMKINCGPVAMSLTNTTATVQLKRTSKAP